MRMGVEMEMDMKMMRRILRILGLLIMTMAVITARKWQRVLSEVYGSDLYRSA